MYTIGEVSQMFDLPISTLRYYDKEGLFPNMQRVSGIRQFNEGEIELLRLIECLKRSGLEIKDIKKFIDLTAMGPATYSARRDIFLCQKEIMEAEMEKMQKALDMIQFKIWYYDTAMKDGSEDGIRSMLPDNLPDEIQKLYDHAHEN